VTIELSSGNVPVVPSLDDLWLLGGAAERRVVELAVAPCIDAYESGVGTVAGSLRAVARIAGVEPVRTVAAAAAEVIRDVGAAQVSALRWLLDA
jgi:hypothetical protein